MHYIVTSAPRRFPRGWKKDKIIALILRQLHQMDTSVDTIGAVIYTGNRHDMFYRYLSEVCSELAVPVTVVNTGKQLQAIGGRMMNDPDLHVFSFAFFKKHTSAMDLLSFLMCVRIHSVARALLKEENPDGRYDFYSVLVTNKKFSSMREYEENRAFIFKLLLDGIEKISEGIMNDPVLKSPSEISRIVWPNTPAYQDELTRIFPKDKNKEDYQNYVEKKYCVY